ncbi:MAG: hypothetical protein Q6351_006995 [Candidatus Njordarchaeum guaymaensis]
MEPIGTVYLIHGEKISEKAYEILVNVYSSIAIKAAYPSKNIAIFILKNPDPTEQLYRVILLTREKIWASNELSDPEDALTLYEAVLELETK